MRRLLFLCTGNTCRSPLAEVIARQEATRRELTDVEIRSAGTHAWPDQPASLEGVLVARDRGLDLGAHQSTRLDFDLLAWADLALGMSLSHLDAAIRAHPAVRAELITNFLPEGHPSRGATVGDPIGGGRREYEETYKILAEAIQGLFDRVAPR